MPDKKRELNRLQKLLEGANIKLSGTVSDIGGKTGRADAGGYPGDSRSQESRFLNVNHIYSVSLLSIVVIVPGLFWAWRSYLE